MTIERIKKIFIISTDENREEILFSLQRLGAVQVEDIIRSKGVNSEDTAENANLDENKEEFDWSRFASDVLPERRAMEKTLEKIEQSITFLHKYIPQKPKIKQLLEGPESVSPDDRKKILLEFNHDAFTKKIDHLEGRLKDLHAKKLHLQQRKDYLIPWIDLNVPMNYFCQTEHVNIRAVSVPLTRVDECREKAHEEIGSLWSEKVSETRYNKNIIIIYHSEFKEEAERIMNEFDVHNAVFPCVNMTPAETIEKIEEQIINMDQATLEIEEKLSGMTEGLLKLKVVSDKLENELERMKARELCGQTKRTFLVRGWIPEIKLSALDQTLKSVDPDSDLTVSDPEEDEEAPIILNNPRLIRPFESVVNIYGRPSYTEIDPTPSLALFFFIGFGYCLTDAGYGLLLALGFGLAAWKFKLQPSVRKFCWMMTLAGISALILGALTGGWFGNLFTAANLYKTQESAFIPALSKVQLIDPIGRNIILFLGAALVIGYIQLAWGVILNLWNHVRHGRYADAIFDPFAWLLFAGGLVTAYFQPQVGMWISIAGATMMLFFAGRENKNIALRIGGGFWVIYNNIMGLISDVLSYSRLFALGLATTIMATVVNTIAFIIWDVPYVGWIITLLVLLIAHPINLAINVLGAFIHTARLQFVEFFPKFYKSGGHPFKPLGVKHRFISIKKLDENKIR